MRLPEASRNAVGLLRFLLAVSLLLPLLLFILASWLNYRAAFADATRDLMRTTEVAREQAARVFDSQAQVTERVTELLRGRSTDEILANQQSLHDAFARIVSDVPELQSVLLVDLAGRPLVSAVVYPVPTDIDLRDRDYFKAITAGYTGTFVSDLQVGGVNKQLFIGLSRPWIDMSGHLAGVIDVAVIPAFFNDFYQALAGEAGDDAEGKILALVREDGQILVRYPSIAGALPRAPPGSQFIRAIAADPRQGVYESLPLVQDRSTTRLHVYRRVQGYPLYVVAGRSRQAIIDGWRSTMRGHLLLGIPTTMALFAITWTALVRTRREVDALARARREIERRESAEAALLRSQRLEAIGQMTGGVAHDFNNLLTVILGSADMLSRRADDPVRVRRIAEQIVLAARRGGEVTQQLLAFSRRQLINPEMLDLNRRLQDFKPLLDRAAREAVRVDLELDPKLGLVRLDPGYFEAAILNLVGNARDAMPDGGRIVIATCNVTVTPGQADALPGNYVRVAVIDNGSGMDRQTMAKAFEPFFTTKEIGKGTGLGLSQVYGFAKQAGGDARISSSPGQGTTVELLLPRLDARPDDAAAEVEEVPWHAGRGEVIMVVEDEPGVREMAVESLNGLGYTTLSCPSARAALDYLQNGERVDVLFSDVVMPGGINGFQLATEARRLRPGLKILLTSGYTGTYRDDDLRDLPLLTKPYDRDGLAAQLSTMLSHERRQPSRSKIET